MYPFVNMTINRIINRITNKINSIINRTINLSPCIYKRLIINEDTTLMAYEEYGGVRVLNICDPYKPKEWAYIHTPRSMPLSTISFGIDRRDGSCGLNAYQSILLAYQHGGIIVWKDKDYLHFDIYEDHKDKVTNIRDTSNYIISGSIDSTIRIWNKNTKECETLTYHRTGITDMVMNNTYLISGDEEGLIKVLDIKQGEVYLSLSTYGPSIISLVIKGNILVSTSSDHLIRVWDISSGILINTIGPTRESPNGVIFVTIDKGDILISYETHIAKYGYKEKVPNLIYPTGRKAEVMVGMDDTQYLLVGYEGGELEVWDPFYH